MILEINKHSNHSLTLTVDGRKSPLSPGHAIQMLRFLTTALFDPTQAGMRSWLNLANGFQQKLPALNGIIPIKRPRVAVLKKQKKRGRVSDLRLSK
jgi:hypothetical protein